MMKLKTAHFIAGAVIVTAVALPIVTMAQTPGLTRFMGGRNKTHQVMANNMIFGTVSGKSGTTLTVTDAKGTVYTVDASSAKIDPGMAGAGLSVANIAEGDKVVITGPVTGTNETAKTISDRSMNGRNIFTGTVTAASGSVLTIDTIVNKVKTSYTVDATSATLLKGMGAGTAMTATDIKTGDRIFAIGTLSGTNVAATSVRDLGQMSGRKNKPPMNKPSNMFTGTVTAVNSSIITAIGWNKTTYTINVGTAKLTKGMGKDAATIALSDIKAGDRISAVGAVSGTTVAATSVRDLGQAKPGVHAHRGSGQK
jgi:hypothetical protein